jgi:hypothetical protein
LGREQPLRLFGALLARIELARPLVLVQALIAQRMQCVERLLDALDAVMLLAVGDVVAGEQHVIENRRRAASIAEKVVALRETVVPEAGMGNDERLHRESELSSIRKAMQGFVLMTIS